MSSNSNSTKKSSGLKLRPSVLNSSPAHFMMPSNLPWSPCEMSWALQSHSGVVEFKEFGGHPNNSLLCKRKAQHEQLYTKPKKLITEEKMAEHLELLHISSDFTSHSTPTLEDYSSDSGLMELDSSTSSTDCQFTISSAHDLEQKLRNAQRITICEQIIKLQNEPAILSRFERPCTALVHWQPPPKVAELCVSLAQQYARKLIDEEQDNNNSSSVDFNSMDLDS